MTSLLEIFKIISTLTKRSLEGRGRDMIEKKSIGHEIRTLSNLVKREISSGGIFDPSGSATGMQGMIIGYLYFNSDKEIIQRDIEQEFKIRRSTVTGILQLMEKDGLIYRESVERDGRLKRILLTEKAIEIHHHIQRHLETVDEKITKGISQEEMEVFYSLVNRMKANLEDMKKTDGDKRSSL